ncbi:MAG: PDZ domain-containing protein [Flavitalea sp.]
MKKYLIASATALLLLGAARVNAQSAATIDPNKTDDRSPADINKKLGEYDEIIIKRKDPSKTAKVTIEISNDQVLVNGKPIAEFNDEALAVIKRNANMIQLQTHLRDFRAEGGAFLGVVTEKATVGVKVKSVAENSAAEEAGLKEEDVIIKVNETTISEPADLVKTIGRFKPGEKITITYKRNDKEKKAGAVLGRRNRTMTLRPPFSPDADPARPMPPMPPMTFGFDGDQLEGMFPMAGKPRLGIKAQDTEDSKGVKTLNVDGSPAEKAGIQKDDLITSFDGKEVNTVDELAKAARESRDKSLVKVQVKRNGKLQTIDIKIPRKLKTSDL